MKNIVAEIVEVLKSSKDTIELEQRVHKKLGEFSEASLLCVGRKALC